MFHLSFQDKRLFLIPWILTVLAKSIIDVSHTLYLVMLAAKRLNPIHIVLFTLDFFLLLLTIYAFLCVISQYQEYKAGRGRAEDDLIRHSAPYHPPPTATSCLSARKPGTYHETTATEPHSTLMTSAYNLSPCNHSRKTSTKHVQFGISEEQRHLHGNTLTIW
ncbi:UNVERIFIED_CONTAM: hypothetical protein PYX00_001805 [Menopon gallinae]|uniref:Uncharacterized protein n=1 Tax=Menopon gallinae TaxID=328185 RepID=A0AAW2IEH6_9NEOP